MSDELSIDPGVLAEVLSGLPAALNKALGGKGGGPVVHAPNGGTFTFDSESQMEEFRRSNPNAGYWFAPGHRVMREGGGR